MKGGLAHRLENPKWPPGGPKMANGVHPKQLSLNKFFDLSTQAQVKLEVIVEVGVEDRCIYLIPSEF